MHLCRRHFALQRSQPGRRTAAVGHAHLRALRRTPARHCQAGFAQAEHENGE